MLSLKNLSRLAKNAAMGYSEAQSKVRMATSNDPQSPSPKQLDELLRMTYKAELFNELMETLFKRLEERGKSWQHVYKALIVINHLLHIGPERTLYYCTAKSATIESLAGFRYTDSSDVDLGTHVRLKSQEIMGLLSDILTLREKRRARLILNAKSSILRPSRLETNSNSIRAKLSFLDTKLPENEKSERRDGGVSEESDQSRYSQDPFDPEVVLIIDGGAGESYGARKSDTARESVGTLSTSTEAECERSPVHDWISAVAMARDGEEDGLLSITDEEAEQEKNAGRESRQGREQRFSTRSRESAYTQDSWSAHDHHVLPRPSAPTPGLSPTSDSEDSSTRSFASGPPDNKESPHQGIRPLPTPPRRVSEDIDASIASLERLKALRKLHSALPADYGESPRSSIAPLNVRSKKPRPLPALPGTIDLSNPFVTVLDYFPLVPSHIPQRPCM
ncbi:unnamed protein product [Somion occarium]|uniref:ENTH domain-containing protein n=1 Tax=Somion occarium TaxID=3059160 RepID=A0ABP1DTL7_9APHY